MMTRAEQMAKMFHDVYEELAPQYGYETRKESAVAWGDVPPANRALMMAVCQHIIDHYGDQMIQQIKANMSKRFDRV